MDPTRGGNQEKEGLLRPRGPEWRAASPRTPPSAHWGRSGAHSGAPCLPKENACVVLPRLWGGESPPATQRGRPCPSHRRLPTQKSISFAMARPGRGQRRRGAALSAGLFSGNPILLRSQLPPRWGSAREGVGGPSRAPPDPNRPVRGGVGGSRTLGAVSGRPRSRARRERARGTRGARPGQSGAAASGSSGP